MKQKANHWKIRLYEEIKHDKTGQFITLTFADKAILELSNELKGQHTGYNLDNAIATLAVRRFLERHRKKTGKSIKHFLITELGHTGSENIHLHGILFTTMPRDELANLWNYGFIWTGYDSGKTYVSERTINYITKYITKIDNQHSEFKGKILCSKGIGAAAITTATFQQNRFKDTETNETYTTRTGNKTAIPTYYRNKIYSEEEREKLWIQKLDSEQRWLKGQKFNMKNPIESENYFKALQYQQGENKKKGYGSDERNWTEKKYQDELRNLQNEKRKNRVQKKN